MPSFCRSLPILGMILLVAGFAGAQVQPVERPDAMEVYFLGDVDRQGDRVRVLYQTRPSLEQAVRDDWTVNVYIVEALPDGSVKQRRLASGRRNFASLLLRRGHDEVFVMEAPGPPGSKPRPLEVWSARDGAVLSSTEVPGLQAHLGMATLCPTDDGNLFFVGTNAHGSRGESTGIMWQKLSPGGEVLGKGEHDVGGAKVGPGGVFPAREGGVGLTVMSSVSREVKRLPTDIDNPVKRSLAGRTLEAEVHSETRMLVADAKGKRLWVSPALERTFFWGAGFEIPQDLAVQEKLRQSSDQMRILEEIGVEYGSRTVSHVTTAQADLVRRTSAGYAVLASRSLRRDRVPPAHGAYYLEIGFDGAVRRDLYLEPLAERIGARAFVDFLPTADGGFLLAGGREVDGARQSHLHVTRIDPAGSAASIVSLGPLGWQLDAIAGSAANPWLIGQDWSDEFKRTLLQLQRVDLSAAESLDVAALPAPVAITPEPTPAAQAPEAEPTGDCACSCEGFTEFKELMESVNAMSDADKMKLATDPDYLKTLTCASQCGAGWAQCAMK